MSAAVAPTFAKARLQCSYGSPGRAELPSRQRRTRDMSAMGQTVSRPLLDIHGHARPDAMTQCVTEPAAKSSQGQRQYPER
jgi:hypothetical protein